MSPAPRSNAYSEPDPALPAAVRAADLLVRLAVYKLRVEFAGDGVRVAGGESLEHGATGEQRAHIAALVAEVEELQPELMRVLRGTRCALCGSLGRATYGGREVCANCARAGRVRA